MHAHLVEEWLLKSFLVAVPEKKLQWNFATLFKALGLMA